MRIKIENDFNTSNGFNKIFRINIYRNEVKMKQFAEKFYNNTLTPILSEYFCKM